jgi:hypothetical protein
MMGVPLVNGVSRSQVLQHGAKAQPTLKSNSMIVPLAHVGAGRWASVMPAALAATLGPTETICSIPIVKPEAVHTIGLVGPAHEPNDPLPRARRRCATRRPDRNGLMLNLSALDE